jgi:hypothetical protein
MENGYFQIFVLSPVISANSPLHFLDNQEFTVNENGCHQKVLLFEMLAFFLRKCNKSLENTEKVDVILSCKIC